MSAAVVITGNRGGLGSVMGRHFAEAGFHVIGIDIEADEDRGPGSAHAQIYTDLNALIEPQARSSLADRLESELQGHELKALINNAAMQHVQPLEDLDPSDLIDSLQTNAVAPLTLGQLLFDALERARGAILNISSIHVDQTKRRFGAYSVSKSALSAVSRAMAIEWGDRVRVMELRPAAIATDMLEAGFAGRAEARCQLDEYHPSGRIGSPAEIAAIARSLIELDAPFLNGAVVNADGGISHTLHDPDG